MRISGNTARATRPSLSILIAIVLIAGAATSRHAFAADSDVIVLRSRVFDIPFQIGGDSAAKTVRLLVSSDRGKSWETAADEKVPVTRFHFEADADGEYWFTHTTDLDRVDDPPSGLTPERKILIDSSGPEIALSGESDQDGTVSAQVTLADPHKIATRRVLYATDVDRKWKIFDVNSIHPDGRFEIRASDRWNQLTVHVTATDSLGNVSVEAKTFRRPRIAAVAPAEPVEPVDSLPDDADGVLPERGRVRARTVAGPSDPPSIYLGPAPSITNAPATPVPATPGSAPARSFSPAPSALPRGPSALPRGAAGSYALQAPGQYRGTGSAPAPQSAAPQYASPYRMPTAPLHRPPIKRPSVSPPSNSSNPGSPSNASRSNAVPAGPANPADRSADSPMTLPAGGVVAKVTPKGVEVLPPPAPTPAPDAAVESTNENPSFNAPDASPNVSLDRSPVDPDAPITPSAVPPTTPSRSSSVNPPSNRPRTLADAMRPMGSGSSSFDASTSATTATAAPAPEAIPTPSTSDTDERSQRYRAERAEQFSREQQQRFDRALMARNVPFRYSDSNRFSLEYELEAVGSTGVDAVELYGSLDMGKTWKRWGADPDRSSPFDIETKGEGAFCFRIVVLGNNGLSSPRPLPGDRPDIAVIVDQTKPEIKLTSARYGEGDRTGSLVIRYECGDDNLMNRPVAIAFSDSLEGPWTTIAAGLRNDGLYVWPADPKLPPAIYLRIDATDQAGNTGSYLLDQPIATGGLAPRARILGFQSR